VFFSVNTHFLCCPEDAALGVLKGSNLSDALTKFSKNYASEMAYSVISCTGDLCKIADCTIDPSSREDSWRTKQEELWLAKLGSWSEALVMYEEKLRRDPHDYEAILGCMRCLAASGEWKQLLKLVQEKWPSLSDPDRNSQTQRSISTRTQRKALRMCSQASWRLGQWDDLETYSLQLLNDQNEHLMPSRASGSGKIYEGIDFDGAFHIAVLRVHRNEWLDAADAIDAARKAMDGRLTALMAESYTRAYPSMVTAQTLAEMEEIVKFKRTEELSHLSVDQHPVNRPDPEKARRLLMATWRDRLSGCRFDAEVHSSILSVRSLVLGPTDDVDATLTLSELFCQAQRHKHAERVLLDPLQALHADLDGFRFGRNLPDSLRCNFATGNDVNRTVLTMNARTEQILLGDTSAFLPSYGADHERWANKLVLEAGGYDR
jgi:hypothetical protein